MFHSLHISSFVKVRKYKFAFHTSDGSIKQIMICKDRNSSGESPEILWLVLSRTLHSHKV